MYWNGKGTSLRSYDTLDSGIDAKQGELQRLRSTMEATAAAQKDLTNQAFEAYCETLNEAYAQADLQ